MASITELEQWDEELYQLETTDPVVGGPEGISNRQAKTLGNRTKYLKALILNAIGNDEDFATTIANALSQKVAITDLQKGTHVTAVDTGAANAYVVALSPAVTSLANGMEISFTPANTNTGASTIAVNGLATVPIVGGALSALQGGEIPANGRVKLKYNSTISSFAIVSTTGQLQIPAGVKSNHAARLGQFGNTYTANNSGSNATSASVSMTFTAPQNGKLMINGAVFAGGTISGLVFSSSNATEVWSYGHWAALGASVAMRNGIYTVAAGASVTITMTLTTTTAVNSTLSLMAQFVPTA